MKKYSYDLVLTAPSESNADAKIKDIIQLAKVSETKFKAIMVLAEKLSEKQLSKIADVVENDPIKFAMAKNALGV